MCLCSIQYTKIQKKEKNEIKSELKPKLNQLEKNNRRHLFLAYRETIKCKNKKKHPNGRYSIYSLNRRSGLPQGTSK